MNENRIRTMAADAQGVMPHNEEPARMWGLGGHSYDNISFGVSDALAHTAQRLNAGPGEEVLDVATGTGWSARNVARTGARVTAVDIAPDLLAAAEDLSAHVEPPITFRRADAESLPFGDGSFDRVISTFGVMFAPDQERAARELGRVCRPGGRLALAVWAAEGAVQEFLGLIGRHSAAPPPEPSPLAWGETDHVRDLLGGDFELWFEPGVNNHYFDTVEDVWEWYARGFGPMRNVIDSLAPDQLAAFRRDIDAYHGKYAVDAGLHIRREYLVITGRRR